jgi:hypothetical protein
MAAAGGGDGKADVDASGTGDGDGGESFELFDAHCHPQLGMATPDALPNLQEDAPQVRRRVSDFRV